MTVPLVRLSSLDLLRGFVAVGRRLSITQAADDLCLTQSAVSRQVHQLEDQLGCRLFLRQHRGVAFTPEGERLFRSADGALQQLQDVMGELRRTEERGPSPSPPAWVWLGSGCCRGWQRCKACILSSMCGCRPATN